MNSSIFINFFCIIGMFYMYIMLLLYIIYDIVVLLVLPVYKNHKILLQYFFVSQKIYLFYKIHLIIINWMHPVIKNQYISITTKKA